MAKCNDLIIKLRQGDDSDFNDNHILFHIVAPYDLDGWKARFKLQGITWMFDEIKNNQIELIISKYQTNQLEIGTCYGWLQLIDENGKSGTVFTQRFQILRREVF